MHQLLEYMKRYYWYLQIGKESFYKIGNQKRIANLLNAIIITTFTDLCKHLILLVNRYTFPKQPLLVQSSWIGLKIIYEQLKDQRDTYRSCCLNYHNMYIILNCINLFVD